MYKNFKQGFVAETDLLVTRSLSNLSVLTQNAANEKRDEERRAGLRSDSDITSSPDPEVLETVRTCWEKVSAQCVEYGHKQLYPCGGKKTGWQTVRLFVSSTFTDFFWEREMLVKRVFPELREWCEARQLYLVECDLRWGVVKDTTTADTILVCLEELDRCLEETGGEAFFLNMLGERYGWIPALTDIPDSVREKYGWVPDTSITFMEVLHGAYRLRNPNALFMVRDGSLLDNIPQGQRSRFKDMDDLSVEHLKHLKSWLPSRFPDQIQSYTAQMEGMVTKHDKEMVKVGGLEEFCDKVLSFFKKTIETHYPGRCGHQMRQSVVLAEDANQKTALDDRAGSVNCRARETSLIAKFMKGETSGLQHEDGLKPFARKPEDWSEVALCNNVPLCVCGPPGYGKSTLLAGSVHNLTKDKGCNVFYHFCGATARSDSVEVLLQRLIAFFSQDYSQEHLASLETMDEDHLKSRWRDEIKSFKSRGDNQPTVLVIDALDQLSTCNQINHLSWLPPAFPEGIRCVLSTTQHPATVARVKEHANYILDLDPLTPEDARTITSSLLGKFSKQLDNDQLELILGSECSQNPLWLQLVCEELRIYGDFRTLTKHMKNVTVSLDGMIETILVRLRAEDDIGLAEKALAIVVSAVGPVTALDLQRMLGDMASREPIPTLVWAQLRRHLNAVLHTKHFNDELHFVHNKVKMVIYDSLIKSRTDRIQWSKLLADYIEYWSDSTRMKVEDLPRYLRDANLNGRMVNYLRKVPESSKVISFRRSQFMQVCRCKTLADPVIKNVTPVYICTFCKMGRATFCPNAFHSNKDMCVVCGVQVTGFPSPVIGHLCPFHAIRAGSQHVKCFLCNRIADPKTAVPGKLCMNCGFGNHGKQCISVDQ